MNVDGAVEDDHSDGPYAGFDEGQEEYDQGFAPAAGYDLATEDDAPANGLLAATEPVDNYGYSTSPTAQPATSAAPLSTAAAGAGPAGAGPAPASAGPVFGAQPLVFGAQPLTTGNSSGVGQAAGMSPGVSAGTGSGPARAPPTGGSGVVFGAQPLAFDSGFGASGGAGAASNMASLGLGDDQGLGSGGPSGTAFADLSSAGKFGFVAKRIVFVQGYYVVSYALGIYLLNLLVGFVSPKVDPMADDGAPLLPTKSDDSEYRPFMRKLPEFAFWYSATRATLAALFSTFFAIFDVPVYWPVLLMYFVVLTAVTFRKQYEHMRKHNYVPWSFKKVYGRK
ncbi:Rer1 domain-containing protein [Thecamonas trahens ATCC 50062]|uniref:Rer1 domain-containing protein n=1 Tax=Thecamonas trahens ATCC 50062 TaxID=461836 RepID=A0A0L0DIZ8_THETB|nr:Rer1 domain-containing protein [Thecamonas trahens ATCC 50062]KNC52287.1 Rer1 domain-containing protein [Thecamonas trahens ATCC 50062]|eukprot:XP_013762286.1 Rer1 domain-containing protein [Thecamonas trahens ATCC 50062]